MTAIEWIGLYAKVQIILGVTGLVIAVIAFIWLIKNKDKLE